MLTANAATIWESEKAMNIRTKTQVTSKVTINLWKRSPIEALAAGAAAAGVLVIGVLAIRALAVKKGRIQRLDIEELGVGRLHVRELVVE